MRDVESVYEAECKSQGRDDPDLGEGIYNLLKKHRKLLQSLIQLQSTDARKESAELGLRPVALRPGGPTPRSLPGSSPPKTGQGAKVKSPMCHPLCPVCNGTSHKPGHLWRCPELLIYAKMNWSFPPDMCQLCCIQPAGAPCKIKKCIEGKNERGRPRDRTCKDCGKHRYLGTCKNCLESAARFRETVLVWAQRDLKKGSKQAAASAADMNACSAVVNGMPVGESLTLSEVVQAKTVSGDEITICLLFDSQAETSCMSQSLHRLSHPRLHPDSLTIHGVGASTKRPFSEKGTLTITDFRGKEIKLEGLLQDHPMAKPKFYSMPPEWADKYRGNLAIQVKDKPTNYSVLVGSDLHIHPLPVLAPEGGQQLDSSGALALFQSQITNR